MLAHMGDFVQYSLELLLPGKVIVLSTFQRNGVIGTSSRPSSALPVLLRQSPLLYFSDMNGNLEDKQQIQRRIVSIVGEVKVRQSDATTLVVVLGGISIRFSRSLHRFLLDCFFGIRNYGQPWLCRNQSL